MHAISRETLIGDLAALLRAGRDDLDMLVITPRLTSNGLIVMVRSGTLQLIYPQAGWFDLPRVVRFWMCGLRNKLSPRFVRWGAQVVHRVSLASDPTSASAQIDEFFKAVYGMSGPFALDFTRLGWQPTS